MPRRLRPWATTRPTIMLAATAAAATATAFMITCGSSVAFVQLQIRPSSLTANKPGSRSWVKARSDTSWYSAANASWRRSTRETLRLEIQRTEVAPASEEPLAGASSSERPAPFISRKLGSFEKMLTQTRDGVGPAEEGVRTLLTPHVWVSRACL